MEKFEKVFKELGSDNIYQILHLDKYADLEKVKKAYKKLMKTYHPDKNKNIDSLKIFENVRKAYEILQNTEDKLQYDEYLRRQDEKANKIKSFTETRRKFIDDLNKREKEAKNLNMKFSNKSSEDFSERDENKKHQDFFIKKKHKYNSESDEELYKVSKKAKFVEQKLSTCGIKIKWSKNSDLIFNKDVILSFFKSYGIIEDIRIEETKCEASLLFQNEKSVENLMMNFPEDQNLNKLFKIKKCSSKKFDEIPLFLDTKSLDIIKNLKLETNQEFMKNSALKNDKIKKEETIGKEKVDTSYKFNYKLPSFQMSLEELEEIAFEMLKNKINNNK